MTNSKNTQNEISVFDLMAEIKSKLIYIIVIPSIVSVLFFLYLKSTEKESYKATFSIIANLEKEEFTTSFGSYEFVSKRFEDFSEFIVSDVVLNKTISDLDLNLSISELKSGINYSIKSNPEGGGSLLNVEIILGDTTIEKILSRHLNNYTDYLNYILDKSVINNFISEVNTLISDKSEAIASTKTKISRLDSILAETEEFRIGNDQISSLYKKNFIIEKSLLINDAYLAYEEELVRLNLKLETDIITLKNYHEKLNILTNIKDKQKAQQNRFNSHFNILNDFIVVANKTSGSLQQVNNDIFNKLIRSFIVTFVLIFVFYIMRSIILLNKRS